MARFCGVVGFAEHSKTSPGVYEEIISEQTYYGDVVRDTRSLKATDGKNDDVEINNSISILADAYALQNFHSIRYVEWLGAKWRVSSIEVQPPRLILSIGGVYNA